MRTLGVDPGTVRTGWGIVQRHGTRVQFVASGVIRSSEKMALALRLRRIFEELREVIAVHSPEAVAVEDIFYAKHANAALKLGHARGVALTAASLADLDVFAYPPTVVKKTVAGSGSAEKTQIAQILRRIFKNDSLGEIDATDALAIAMTHSLAAQAALSARQPKSVPITRRVSATSAMGSMGFTRKPFAPSD